MAIDPIDEHGNLIGTRITVYNLLVDFLDPTKTEGFICELYNLTAGAVAAARAFVLNNPDTVLARHLEIEKRIAEGNPPEVMEQAKKTHALFARFREWVIAQEKQRAADERSEHERNGKTPFPSFREWLAQQEAQPTEGS